MVLFLLCKVPGYLELAQWAQHAEITGASRQVTVLVFMKILFEFKALGVLVGDRASLDRAFVGAGFIGKGHLG